MKYEVMKEKMVEIQALTYLIKDLNQLVTDINVQPHNTTLRIGIKYDGAVNIAKHLHGYDIFKSVLVNALYDYVGVLQQRLHILEED